MITEAKGLQITGNIKPGYEQILTTEALQFIERIERHFSERRKELLNGGKAFRKN